MVDDLGEVCGTYYKRYPVEAEIATGITAGGCHGDPRSNVIECPRLGGLRVGVAICFDLNWPGLFSEMKNEHADLICWISAYPGGLPLQIRALESALPVVTSVQGTQAAKYIDIAGRVVSTTSRWQRLLLADINVGRRLFHTDGQMHSLLAIQEKYGARVHLETLDEEHLFTLEVKGPGGTLPAAAAAAAARPAGGAGEAGDRDGFDGLTVEDIIVEFGLVDYADYIQRCTAFRNAHVERCNSSSGACR
jgi:hypothetical protein